MRVAIGKSLVSPFLHPLLSGLSEKSGMRILWVLLALVISASFLHSPTGRPLWDRLAGAVSNPVVITDANDPRSSTGKDKVVMLAAEWCGYCRRQQADFARAGVRYTVLDVDTPAGDLAMQALAARGIPVTVIGQDVVRGYNPEALNKRLTPLGYRVY